MATDRRDFLGWIGAGVVAGGCAKPRGSGVAALGVAQFEARRRHVPTASGDIAFVEQGAGPPAVFVHGVPLNGLHWRHVMAELSGVRRCIAIDLMGLGHTRIDARQPVSFDAQARMLLEFLDALGLARVDLVANDSGGAICQIFAAHHPERVRTLTLTNCDVHDNWPPEIIRPSIEAARAGVLVERYAALIDQPAERLVRFSRAYANPAVLTDEVYRAYIEPLIATAQRRHDFHRYWTAFDNTHTRAVESKLRELRVPTLVVWALDDVFFDVKWAHWLADTIPGARRPVTVPEAKLFFPEDRPQALLEPLWDFLWANG